MEQVWCQDGLILTEQVWSIEDLLYKCWPTSQISSFAQVADQNRGFAPSAREFTHVIWSKLTELGTDDGGRMFLFIVSA